MRTLALLLITGCSFTGTSEGPSDGSATRDSRAIDGRTPPPIDAAIDARRIDARSLDAAPIPVRFVQGNSANSGAVTLAAVETAGDLNVVGVSWSNAGVSITAVADSDGNTYTRIGSPIILAGSGVLASYYAPDLRQGTTVNRVSVTFSSPAAPIVMVAEYAGLATTNPLDVSSTGAGMGSTLATSAVTTAHPHELLVGIAAASRAVSAGAGFTLRVPASLDLIEDREVTTVGNDSATASLGSAGGWTIGLAAFVAAD